MSPTIPAPGTRIKLADTVTHAEFKGMAGTVKRYIKSSKTVVVICDNGEQYGAYPGNVIITEEATP